MGAESFELIWVCRSADLVRGYVAHIDRMIDEMYSNIYGRSTGPNEWSDALGDMLKYTPLPLERKSLMRGACVDAKISILMRLLWGAPAL